MNEYETRAAPAAAAQRKSGLARPLAHASWILPLVGAALALLARRSGVPLVERAGVLGASVVIFAGLVVGITALARMGAERATGVLAPALIGLALDLVLMCGIFAGAVTEGMRVREAREDAQKKVTAASSKDATAPIVDEDYRFRLAWPGKGWKLLDHDEAARLAPLAVAGAMFESGKAMGLVAVEKTVRTELAAEAQAIVDSAGGADKEASAFEPASVHGFPALRFHVKLDTAGRRLRYDYVVFLRDGYAFRIATMTQIDASPEARTAFIGAFEPLDGTVRARRRKRVTDLAGPGFRLHGGKLRSPALRLAVEPKGTFHVVVGQELDQIDNGAAVGLVTEDADVTITIGVEPAHGVDPAAYTRKLEAGVADVLGEPDAGAPAKKRGRAPKIDEGERVPFDIGGHVVKLRRFPPVKRKVEHLFGVFFDGEHALRVEAWYEPAIRERAIEQIAVALRGVRILDAATPPDDDRDVTGAVGPRHSFRHGTYRDFERGLVYRAPPGVFRIWVGEEAATQNEGAILSFVEIATGIHGALFAEAASDPEAFHQAVLKRIFRGPTETAPSRSRWGEAEALTSARTFSDGELLQHHDVSTTVRDGVGYRLSIWGLDGNVRAASALVDALRAGLSFPEGGVGAVEIGAGSYRDQRFGFGVSPPAGWRLEDQTKPEERALSTVLRWSNGSDWLMVSAAGTNETGIDFHFVADMVEQRMRELVPASTPEPATLAGRPCRRLRAPSGGGPDIYLVTAHRTAFTMAMSAPSAKVDAVLRSFELLE